MLADQQILELLFTQLLMINQHAIEFVVHVLALHQLALHVKFPQNTQCLETMLVLTVVEMAISLTQLIFNVFNAIMDALNVMGMEIINAYNVLADII